MGAEGDETIIQGPFFNKAAHQVLQRRVVQLEHIGKLAGFIFVAFQNVGAGEGEFDGVDCVTIFSEVDVEDFET